MNAPNLSDLAMRLAEAEREIERLREKLHYANGVAELAMKHREIAESKAEALERALEQSETRPDTYAEQMLRMLGTDTLQSMIDDERRRSDRDDEVIADFEAEIKRRAFLK